MVLSLAPAAFATDYYLNIGGADQPLPSPVNPTKEFAGTAASNKAISNAKKNIEYMYNAYAADNAVFGAIQSMDSIVVDLAKGLFDGVDDVTRQVTYWVADPTELNGGHYERHMITLTNDTLVDNTKALLRGVLGDTISDYMNDHLYAYADVSTHLERTEDGVTYRMTSAGSTKDKNAIYYDTQGYVFAYDKANDQWKFASNDVLRDAVKAVDTTMTDAKWAALTPAQRAAKANLLSISDACWWNQDNDTMAIIKDYDYDPIKYADTYAAAMTKALSSEKGVAGIQSYMYALMQTKVMKDVNDKLKDDFWPAVEKWEDGTAILAQYGWGENTLDPYSFIDPKNLPKSVNVNVNPIFAPDSTSIDYIWNDATDSWILD